MPELAELSIATNIEDLERLACTEKIVRLRNTQLLEKAIKKLYHETFLEISDQEKCFILCLRYVTAIDQLCKFGDAKFVKIKYGLEISRVNNKIKELRDTLEQRYKKQEEKERKQQKKSTNKHLIDKSKSPVSKEQCLFPGEFISVKDLYQAIQGNENILIVDIRPEVEFLESKIQFDKIINISEDIISAGLSAHALETKLNHFNKELWEKRDSFTALVFLDWNSGCDNVTSSKLNHLKVAVTEWDCRRKYKQHPVILNGGFKEFLDSYPLRVTNVHINFIRNNEDMDELLELDGISYPEPDQNVSIMPLKQFTIEGLEDSVKDEEQPNEDTNEGIETNNDEDFSDNVSNDINIEQDEIKLPKGGGASLDKSLINLPEIESTDKIKSKIEEQRLRLLMEARNNKNKLIVYPDKKDYIEESVGDRPKTRPKKIPPAVRRETKPKRHEFEFGGWCGLVNIKNTCYMNTMLQCLKCIPVISAFVHSYFEKHITRRPPQIINEFASTIRKLCEGTEFDRKVFSPTNFYEAVCRLDPIYRKGRHEDCMEFFLFLFNHLSDDCAYDIKKSNVMIEREKAWYGQLQGRTSLWVDLFYHQFKCTKVCLVCHSTADSYETDNTLMLPVPYRPSLQKVHLKDLIFEYLEDNQILDYKCSKCNNMRVINKKSVVVEPEILVIVLKRYYQDEYQETRKNNIFVDFDHRFRFGNCYYKLYSVAQHKGTMEFGHYYAHGYFNDNMWVEFNDERTARFTGDWDSIKGSVCAFFYCKESKGSKL